MANMRHHGIGHLRLMTQNMKRARRVALSVRDKVTTEITKYEQGAGRDLRLWFGDHGHGSLCREAYKQFNKQFPLETNDVNLMVKMVLGELQSLVESGRGVAVNKKVCVWRGGRLDCGTNISILPEETLYRSIHDSILPRLLSLGDLLGAGGDPYTPRPLISPTTSLVELRLWTAVYAGFTLEQSAQLVTKIDATPGEREFMSSL